MDRVFEREHYPMPGYPQGIRIEGNELREYRFDGEGREWSTNAKLLTDQELAYLRSAVERCGFKTWKSVYSNHEILDGAYNKIRIGKKLVRFENDEPEGFDILWQAFEEVLEGFEAEWPEGRW